MMNMNLNNPYIVNPLKFKRIHTRRIGHVTRIIFTSIFNKWESSSINDCFLIICDIINKKAIMHTNHSRIKNLTHNLVAHLLSSSITKECVVSAIIPIKTIKPTDKKNKPRRCNNTIFVFPLINLGMVVCAIENILTHNIDIHTPNPKNHCNQKLNREHTCAVTWSLR